MIITLNNIYNKIVEGVRSIIMKSNRVLYYTIKRLFDLFCAIIGLIFLLPIMLVVKITYVLNGDNNKILFVQNRIGKNGREFKFYKFRTMVPNADAILEKLLAENKELAKEYKINKKLQNDPRITKIGKKLRKFSLDELPQVINILKGDMAVIGNRPYLPREKEDMGAFYKDIITTKPGLTGYWQVSGRNDVTFEKRLELEQYYSNHCGLIMDLKIFFKTFKVVIFGRGAK